MKIKKMKIVFLPTVLFLIVFFFIYSEYKSFLGAPLNISTDIYFSIEKGSNFNDLSKKLKSYHIIDKTYYLNFYGRVTGYSKEIKSGEYYLTPGLSPIELVNIFVSGDVAQHSITLLEGWNITKMLSAIASNNILKQRLKNHSSQSLLSQLDINRSNPEGLFFPDTYYFVRGTTDIELLKRAYERQNMILKEEWRGRSENLPYSNEYEALIMASIIEKETALPSERSIIAGVFIRRLENKMRLQTDPTVIYAMGDEYKGNIRKKDLSIDSPYNTYRYFGLPPSPIALIGREAIHAALHPEKGESLYFVAKKDGSHYFSKTLEEHNSAVRKYQLNRD